MEADSLSTPRLTGHRWENRLPADRERQEGLSPRVKIVTVTANIKAASLWPSGNIPAVRALFMITYTAHEKKLTSGRRVF